MNGDPMPHLFTHQHEGVPPDHPSHHVHAGLDLETQAGAQTLVDFVGRAVSGLPLLGPVA